MDYSPPGSSVHGDSPSKNIVVSCHARLHGIFSTQESNLRLLCLLHWQGGSLLAPSVQSSSVTQSCSTLCDPVDCGPPGSSVHGDSPGKNTRVSCHALLQGIFPTQGSNLGLLCLLHWQVCSLPLVPPGKPLNTCRCDQ